jgi:hypothetical protein
MRLWSLHPRYLDAKGLVALWREALLAQAVLAGKTRGYKHHPQLTRFIEAPAPRKYIAAYLRQVHVEALRRGYNFDARKIGRSGDLKPVTVTTGQLRHERSHVLKKLAARAPSWRHEVPGINRLDPHPLFRVVPGNIAEWEVVAAR